MKKIIILICLISLLLTACSEIEHHRANDIVQIKENVELTKVIETAKEDIATFFESHKQPLDALSQALLRIMHEDSNVNSINVHHDRAEVELFSADGTYSVLSLTDLPNLDELLSAVEVDTSPFKIVCASSAGVYFDSPTCQYGMSIYQNEQLYYYIELTYTEDANATVKNPDVTEQLAPHWYIISYYWY